MASNDAQTLTFAMIFVLSKMGSPLLRLDSSWVDVIVLVYFLFVCFAFNWIVIRLT